MACTSGGHAPPAGAPALARSDTVGVAERGRAVSAVLAWRSQEVTDGARAGACSVYHGLGRTAQFAEHLAPETRAFLGGDAGESCRNGSDIRPPSYPWWVLDSVARGADGELVVVATLIGKSGNRHTETYRIVSRAVHDGSVIMVVVEMRIDQVRIA